MSADTNVTLSPDAVAWHYSNSDSSPLPDWYMAPAMGVRRGRGARAVVSTIIFAFLLIDASGLCVTSGFLSWA